MMSATRVHEMMERMKAKMDFTKESIDIKRHHLAARSLDAEVDFCAGDGRDGREFVKERSL